MAGRLLGRHLHNVDVKGRVIVPSKLRAQLGETFVAAAVLCLIPAYCLWIYDRVSAKKRAEREAALAKAGK